MLESFILPHLHPNPSLQAVLQLSIKNRRIKLIRIKPQLDTLRQLGTSDLHPPVLTGLLISDFVDAVVVKVPDFASPVTPADPGFREAVVIVMTMSHKNKTRYTKTNKTKNMSLYIKTTIFHVVIYIGKAIKAMKSIP
ncbi:hypothetical protein HMPREF2554_02525 [Rothia sp. HMSC071F11]|nr:hypothetical protein HMPREF2554_02525 [Rothia sp. HMSC071F11]